MNSPDKGLCVLLDKRSRVAYSSENKCLPDNYVVILQTLVALLQFETTNAHNFIKITTISQLTSIVCISWFES